MQNYLAVLTIALMMGMVMARVAMMKKRGIEALHFGKLDRTDFLIPPFALFYFYLIIAAAFHLPSVSTQTFFHAAVISWTGVAFCLAGLSFLLWSIISFGQSFRIGIDTTRPDKLVTSGIFAYSRNPIYTAFTLILLGQFLIFSNWILLVYTCAAFWLFHRQVLREEDFLHQHYGEAFNAYCQKVRRYL